MNEQTIPAGMIEVTETEFYKQLKEDKRDIMPSLMNPFVTTWETKNRIVWGWTSRGWKNPGDDEIYAVCST